MKKLLIAAAATALAAPAFAQTDAAEFQLSGELEKSCDLVTNDASLQGLDMESLSEQGAAYIATLCNYGGSATVEFSSANSGDLVSGSNRVPYTVRVTGNVLPAGTSLASPVSGNFPAVVGEQGRSLRVTLTQIATVAGIYTDTITASVTPN